MELLINDHVEYTWECLMQKTQWKYDMIYQEGEMGKTTERRIITFGTDLCLYTYQRERPQSEISIPYLSKQHMEFVRSCHIWNERNMAYEQLEILFYHFEVHN